MNLSFFKQHFNNRRTNKILLTLISIDFLFMFLHVLFVFLVFKRVQFDWSIVGNFMVQTDGGYPEIFQYFKFFIIVLILSYFLFKRLGIGYISWLLLYILLLLDDSLQFHERFGTWVTDKFNYVPMYGLRAQDLGELTYAGLFGSILLFFLAIGFYFGNEVYRKVNIDLMLLFAFLLFFGVGVDMFDELVETNRYTLLFFNLFEDGGEMIALSIILWYFCFLVIKPKDHNTYLFQYFINRKK